MSEWLIALPQLAGDASVLKKAQEIFADAPAEVAAALDEVTAINAVVTNRFPCAQLYFDLSELRGYHYLTGIVFGAFAPGVGYAIASGGRYDHVGESFGRSRAATGFAVNITAVGRALNQIFSPEMSIFAPGVNSFEEDQSLWLEIQRLRRSGERVTQGLSMQISPFDYQNCDRQLVKQGEKWVVERL